MIKKQINFKSTAMLSSFLLLKKKKENDVLFLSLLNVYKPENRCHFTEIVKLLVVI